MIRTAIDAQSDLSAHLKNLSALVDEAHDEFIKEVRGIAHKLHSRSIASVYRDLIVAKLRKYCDEASGATSLRKGQLFLIGLENNWVIRVKRLKSGFGVAVSPTLASEEYNANQLPSFIADLFPNHPPPTCLYLGWSVAENAPQEIRKFLVCNDENQQVLWVLPLDESDPTPPFEQELPFVPVVPQVAPKGRVKVKGSVKRKVNE